MQIKILQDDKFSKYLKKQNRNAQDTIEVLTLHVKKQAKDLKGLIEKKSELERKVNFKYLLTHFKAKFFPGK